MAKVLVVEDDVALRGVLLRGLREEGFEAVGVGTGAELLDRIEPEAPNVLIVDIGLPDADGRDVCQALRAQGVETPVLFLSARDALTDRVTGFSAGGDDYVTKPFAFAELVARLHALLRRAGETEAIETRRAPTRPARACGVRRRREDRADADRVQAAREADREPGPGGPAPRARPDRLAARRAGP